jgi:hypothetical protein
MRLLVAIDPGPTHSAICESDERLSVVGGTKIANETLLLRLHQINIAYPGSRCAIEMIASFGMPVGREVFETCVWIGRFMEAFGADRCDRITRIEIKSHLCHSAKAKDSNIRQAIIDRLGPPGTKKHPGGTYGISGDIWSALAVALTWWDTRGHCMEVHEDVETTGRLPQEAKV